MATRTYVKHSSIWGFWQDALSTFMGFTGLVSNTILPMLPTVPDPAQRKPLTFSAVAPIFVCYGVQAVLVQLPRTRAWKLIFLSIMIWSVRHAITEYSLSERIAYVVEREDVERFHIFDYLFVTTVLSMLFRAVEWTFASKPYRRLRLGVKSEPNPQSVRQLFEDAFDLAGNQRGFGWSWSRNPFPKVPPRSVTDLIQSLLLKLSITGVAVYSIQFTCPAIDPIGSDSIFDPSLHPLTRYAYAIWTTLMSGIFSYAAMDSAYLFGAVTSCLFFGRSTSQWPPFSDRPYLSTSLAEFWGKRWHQTLRRTVVTLGSNPAREIFGKPGAVMGAFVLSGLIHDWGLYGLGRRTESELPEFEVISPVGMFFVMMGVGAVLEGVWEEWLGWGKVRGWMGWTWTMVWTVWWGMGAVDEWARRGLLVAPFTLRDRE